jgi:N-acyl-D-aspartate/D-glutamate deacylase
LRQRYVLTYYLDLDPAIAKTQGRTLLDAFQDLVVQAAGPNGKNGTIYRLFALENRIQLILKSSGINRLPMGSEAVAALQEFMSSIAAHSQSPEAQKQIEVSLSEGTHQ